MAVTMKSMVAWDVTPCSSQRVVSEAHIASIFMSKSKPINEAEAGGKIASA
jgi:hypothetical protein